VPAEVPDCAGDRGLEGGTESEALAECEGRFSGAEFEGFDGYRACEDFAVHAEESVDSDFDDCREIVGFVDREDNWVFHGLAGCAGCRSDNGCDGCRSDADCADRLDRQAWEVCEDCVDDPACED
jgi:hypothetical protein